MTDQPDTSRKWEAWFPKMVQAVRFAERLSEPGWWATDVVQRGRTVTFTVAPPPDAFGPDFSWAMTELDYRDTVGYYGSSQDRKAKLNGRPCPMSY